ncbi:hypothetical protein [Salinibacter grassmerensis]|uniref:hypothetical protein n=1 Tax=Salinibacter grassmerensis TaxID=3040353 RepID=UPI0021E86EDE|nr:hypothetical protein [Salinibacter grassmerensis]
MSLTLEQQRAVANHLKSRAQPPQCPVCSAANMTVQEEVTLLPTDADDPSTVPRVNVLCEYCGYVLHFSPSALGLSLQ